MTAVFFYALAWLAQLKHRHMRRRLVERTLHKLGVSRRKCDRIARRVP